MLINLWKKMYGFLLKIYLGRSPVTCELVENGELIVVGAVYDLSTGEVRWLGSHPEEKIMISTFKK